MMPETEIIIPDSIEPYIAYKSLSAKHDQWFTSPSRSFIWPEREKAVARCHHGVMREGDAHQIAGKGCSCGIYAVPYEERRKLGGYFNNHHVIVRVAMWGRITIGTKGARAQFAYPQEILAWTCLDQRARRLAELYGIGIVIDNPRKLWIEDQPEEEAAA